jgi:16S rRNA processing protein RimM
LTAPVAADDLLAIGRVGRAHGLKGEVRVDLFNADSDALEQVEELWLSKQADGAAGAKAHAIEWARAVPKAYLVKLEGVSERNAAEALRGSTVWVSRGALETDESQYFLVDLIGARVTGPEGDLGTVVEIATHPSVDSIVIETPAGGRVEQPLLDDFVERVSIPEKLVVLSSLDGLLR